MSSHNDNHHTEEQKPVAFRTPMILGFVTLLAIVLLVSTCDKKHHHCDGDCACEKTEEHHGGHEANEHGKHASITNEEHQATDTTATEDEFGFIKEHDGLETDSVK